jgi:hypothetical protein
MYSYGEREHHGAKFNDSKCVSSEQCYSMCEQRECECNGRRRSKSVYVCMDGREYEFNSHGHGSRELYGNSNG